MKKYFKEGDVLTPLFQGGHLSGSSKLHFHFIGKILKCQRKF